jgi:hypothetical protein
MKKRIEIEYIFEGECEQEDVYKVVLDSLSLQTIVASDDGFPDWIDLSFHQCPNCSLDVTVASHCPAAVNMVGLVRQFDGTRSFDNASVVVVTAERKTCSHTTVQRGLCSLIGLLMATSGCPLTTFFKPMARFHLPFANIAETMWRSTSMYVMTQYFQNHSGGSLDLEFEGLRAIYNQVHIVNKAFARRLRAGCQQDAIVNCIILLDIFAKSMPEAIEASLADFRHLFGPYLNSTLNTNT